MKMATGLEIMKLYSTFKDSNIYSIIKASSLRWDDNNIRKKA